MIRTRLHASQFELAQPLADRAFGDRYRETPGHLCAQVNTAPTHDPVLLRIRTGDNQFAQLSHLHFGQLRCRARRTPRQQACNTDFIKAVHPVAQGLPVHAGLTGGLKA
jgi:hypothetical protein